MTKFVLRRLIRGLVSLLLFQTMLFALFHALPYDFSSLVGGGRVYRHVVQARLGLDQPLAVQYGRWLWDFIQFDLGRSYLFWPAPVSTVLLANASRTLVLFLSGAVLAYLFGLWIGKIMAWRRGGLLEAVATLGGVASYTSFAPFLGFVMINFFARRLGWFPFHRLINFNLWYNAPVGVDRLLGSMVITGALAFGALIVLRWATPRIKRRWVRLMARLLGSGAIASGVWLVWNWSNLGYLAVDVLHHLALPLITVILLSFGETMMLMRMSMLETMREEYVRTAQAIGYSHQVVRDRHVARNAIMPVLTRLALNLPFVLVGSLVIERVFFWTAMGQVVFSAIEFYDVPLLLGILSVVGVLTLLAHILLDILYAFLDPRLRYAAGD